VGENVGFSWGFPSPLGKPRVGFRVGFFEWVFRVGFFEWVFRVGFFEWVFRVGFFEWVFRVGVPRSVFLLLPHKYIVLNGC